MRAIAVRLAQIVFGLLLGIVVMEIVLQCGALITSWRPAPPAPGAHGRRIVFLGDSNTVGFGAGPGNSYPMVLDRLWNRAPVEQHIEVLNLGVVGINSSKIRQQFRNILATLRPDLVTLMVGANDFWTVPAPLREQESTWHYRLWSASRAYRFLYMLGKAWGNAGVKRSDKGRALTVGDDVQLEWTNKVSTEPPSTPSTGPPRWKGELRQNLEAVVADGRGVGVDVVLLTYPAETAAYGKANAVIRAAGAAAGARVIDLGDAFLRVCPSRECPDLFQPDGHPTARGHQLAATLLAEQLVLPWRASAQPQPSIATPPTAVPNQAAAHHGADPERPSP